MEPSENSRRRRFILGPPAILQVLEPVVQPLDSFLFLRLGIDPVEARALCLLEGGPVFLVRRGDPLVDRRDPVLHLVFSALEGGGGAIESADGDARQTLPTTVARWRTWIEAKSVTAFASLA